MNEAINKNRRRIGVQKEFDGTLPTIDLQQQPSTMAAINQPERRLEINVQRKE